jgi:hypothetical protein
MIDLIRSLAAANGIQCKCTDVYLDNAIGVEVVIPRKALMPDSFIVMLLPEGATGTATGLGVILIRKSL